MEQALCIPDDPRCLGGRPPADDGGPVHRTWRGVAASPRRETSARGYYWLVNRAVISPYYDIEFTHGTPLSYRVGDAGATITVPRDPSFASNVL
ncbi:MAG: hypothetical protein ACK5LS_13730, partial [Propioniciclava sp.]